MTKELTKEDVQVIGLAAAKLKDFPAPWTWEQNGEGMADSTLYADRPDAEAKRFPIASIGPSMEWDLVSYFAALDPDTIDSLCELAWRYLDLQD